MLTSDLHTILFDRNYYNVDDIVDWLYKHNIKPIKKMHIQKNYIRTRIKSPKLFSSFYTVKLPEHIQLVIGRY
jgi:hypothetical protein